MIRSLGIDPGFAKLGLAVLEYEPSAGPPRVIEATVVTTTKSSKAERTTEDDVQRMQTLWRNIEQFVVQYKPDVIGVEVYTVYKPTQGGHKGKGAGWKALFAYGMACGAAFAHDIPLRVYLPSDLKRRVASRVDASKLDVERSLYNLTSNLPTILAGIPPSAHEHAADAVGHALMALTDWHKDCTPVT